MKAMILAAGRGERMRPWTDHTPKPLLTLGGKPLIEYHLEALARSGFGDIVINIAHLGPRIRDTLGDGHAYGLCIRYSDEGDYALETGGGIYHALPLLGEKPFLVINADVWSDFPLTPRQLAKSDLAHLVMVDNPAHHPAGDFGLQNGRLRTTGNEKLTFSGIGYYRPELFNGCTGGRFPLAPVIKRAAEDDQVSGEHYQGVWNDIGTPQRLEALNRSLRTTPISPAV